MLIAKFGSDINFYVLLYLLWAVEKCPTLLFSVRGPVCVEYVCYPNFYIFILFVFDLYLRASYNLFLLVFELCVKKNVLIIKNMEKSSKSFDSW